jgi:hypothetical protein
VLALPQDTRLMILAPVAREKKGEFLDVFAEMQAQGYVRFRVNGKTCEFDDLPALKKTEKHDIDVVIDRIKVRPDMQQRLAESFEAALRLANGRAIALEMDTPDHSENDSALRSIDEAYSPKEHLFNAKFACPICSHSISELEPRLFSFNSPVGACPSCDGLGQQDFFDPARVVAFPSLSLASGAIKGWDRRNGYYFSMLESLAKHYKFDIDKPFESLPPDVQQAILHGSGQEEIKFSYVMDSGASQGKKLTKKHPFEGILPNMSRRYRETDSALVREDLARYRSTQPCQACNGSRLRLEARHVKIGEGDQARAIFEISRATLRESFAYFQSLTMHGAKGDIAAKVVREIGLRLKFLNGRNSSGVSHFFSSTSSRCTTASTPPKPCSASRLNDQNRSLKDCGWAAGAGVAGFIGNAYLPVRLVVFCDTDQIFHLVHGTPWGRFDFAAEGADRLYVVAGRDDQVFTLLARAFGLEGQIEQAVIGADVPGFHGLLGVKVKVGVAQRNEFAVQPQHVFVVAKIAVLQVEADAGGVRRRPAPLGVTGQQAVGIVKAGDPAVELEGFSPRVRAAVNGERGRFDGGVRAAPVPNGANGGQEGRCIFQIDHGVNL